jgi:hypothetical protein
MVFILELSRSSKVLIIFCQSGVKEDWLGLDKELAKDQPVLVFDNRGLCRLFVSAIFIFFDARA